MERKKFDIIVLGAGPGGYPAAIRAAQHGRSVALVEAQDVGGTCLNRGCIPSKALIAGSAWIKRLEQASLFGVQLKEWAFDYSQLALHKDRVVEKMRIGLERLIGNQKGISLFRGYGEFISPREMKVKGEAGFILEADCIIIATGSEPKRLPSLPVDGKQILDSTSLLNLKKLPHSLAIVGGGIIGCEFASLYASLGVKVSILELLPRLLPTETLELSAVLTKAFVKRGIQIETGFKLSSASSTDKGVVLLGEENKKIEAELCLVAIGRSLNTEKIGLEKAGLSTQQNGMLLVDKHMETAVKGLYAVGDIASKWWLAHVASHQGLVAADHACGKKAHFSDEAIPSVIFTDPEIATVGLSLEEALKKGYPAKVHSFPFQALGKAQAVGEPDGFAQIVCDQKSGQVLGAQVVGAEASILIAEMGLAITNELTIQSLSETIHAHPTFSEVWSELALGAEGFPLHYKPRTS